MLITNYYFIYRAHDWTPPLHIASFNTPNPITTTRTNTVVAFGEHLG